MSVNEFTGDVAGESREARASHLAGRLAEAGAQQVILAGPGGWRALAPRATDLPGLILSAPDSAELLALAPPLRVAISAQRLAFITPDASLADSLRS